MPISREKEHLFLQNTSGDCFFIYNSHDIFHEKHLMLAAYVTFNSNFCQLKCLIFRRYLESDLGICTSMWKWKFEIPTKQKLGTSNTKKQFLLCLNVIKSLLKGKLTLLCLHRTGTLKVRGSFPSLIVYSTVPNKLAPAC